MQSWIRQPYTLRRLTRLGSIFTKADLEVLSLANTPLMSRAFHSQSPLKELDEDGRSLLHVCARLGLLEACTSILALEPSSVYVQSGSGFTPVHEAVLSADHATLEKLCEVHASRECVGAFDLAVSQYLRGNLSESCVSLLASHNLWSDTSLMAVMAYCHAVNDWALFSLFPLKRNLTLYMGEEHM